MSWVQTEKWDRLFHIDFITKCSHGQRGHGEEDKKGEVLFDSFNCPESHDEIVVADYGHLCDSVSVTVNGEKFVGPLADAPIRRGAF